LSLLVWHFGDVPTIDIAEDEIFPHFRFDALFTATYWRSKMIELGQENDRAGDSRFVPDLLQWMGRAFGDAVERASHKAVRLGGTQLETLSKRYPLPSMPPTPRGASRSTTRPRQSCGAAAPNLERASSAALGSSIGLMADLCPTANVQWRWR
jgi:hypothetical protein